MLLVSDVHGAFDELAAVAALGEPLLVLGDLVNFVDYRTHQGILCDIAGREFVAEMLQLREAGDRDGSRALWEGFRAGREAEVAASFDRALRASYGRMRDALAGCEAYVTYGNVDRPRLLAEYLPSSARYVDGEVIDVAGLTVGMVGGGVRALGVPGEVPEPEMAEKLAGLGPVDILCTHVAPAVRPLSHDVIGGRRKESAAVLAYLEEHQPRWHYFGDIHQPQATTWRVGRTQCRNVGYFRATGRPTRHG